MPRNSNPYKRKIPTDVEKLTGITNEMVYDAEDLLELVNEYINMLNSVNFLYKKMILIKDKNSDEYEKISNIIIHIFLRVI